MNNIMEIKMHYESSLWSCHQASCYIPNDFHKWISFEVFLWRWLRQKYLIIHNNDQLMVSYWVKGSSCCAAVLEITFWFITKNIVTGFMKIYTNFKTIICQFIARIFHTVCLLWFGKGQFCPCPSVSLNWHEPVAIVTLNNAKKWHNSF